MHPFPSLLDGLVTAALALIAGGGPPVAVRLGVAMSLLQFAIGTANDLADRRLDAGRKRGKPLPRGLLSRGAASTIFAACAVVGLALALVSGLATAGVALAGLTVGVAYDLGVKRTIWSWLPFALGVPLLPVFAWIGAVGRVPDSFAVLLPAGVLAGAALAVANLVADVDRDRRAGVDNVATRLGPERASMVAAILYGVVLTLAVGSLVTWQGRGVGVVVAAIGVVVVGSGLVVGNRGGSSLGERAWELQAAGIGLLAAGWLAAIAEAGAL